MPLIGFDYQPRTRLVYGNDSVDRLGELARELDATRILLVTDPGIVAAGHVERARRSLERAGLAVTVFEGVHQNPTTDDVDDCLQIAQTSGVEAFVGLGGGSSLDTAKGCNFLLTNGGRMQDYWGIGKATKPMLPMIAVPTTAGTGSECQSFALIADADSHQKMACGDPKAAARIALLDPTLTVSMPRSVTACTGIDAIAHGLETAVTRPRNEMSLLFSREALRLTLPNLPRALRDPDDLEARGSMLLGAAFAGTAIENSMLGAAHSAANPLTAHFNIVHGQAVGMMLPHVIRFNAEDATVAGTYAELAGSNGLAAAGVPIAQAVEALARRVTELLELAGLPVSLSECGIGEADLAELAEEAAQQWTARFNPRPVQKKEFEQLYCAALIETNRPHARLSQ